MVFSFEQIQQRICEQQANKQNRIPHICHTNWTRIIAVDHIILIALTRLENQDFSQTNEPKKNMEPSNCERQQNQTNKNNQLIDKNIKT